MRLGLLLSEIGRENGVEVSQAEMQRLAAQAAQQYAPKDRQRFMDDIAQDAMAAAQLRAPLYGETDRTVTRGELGAAIEAEDDGGPKPHVHGSDHGHEGHAHDHAGHEHDEHGEAAPAEEQTAAVAAPEIAEEAAVELPAPNESAAK